MKIKNQTTSDYEIWREGVKRPFLLEAESAGEVREEVQAYFRPGYYEIRRNGLFIMRLSPLDFGSSAPSVNEYKMAILRRSLRTTEEMAKTARECADDVLRMMGELGERIEELGCE